MLLLQWASQWEAPSTLTAVPTALVSDQALGPIAWLAPEVLAGSLATRGTATPASDVYMLGGLMFEVLTCGLSPYYWLTPPLTAQRRRVRAGESFRPTGLPVSVTGLGGMSVLEAAVLDHIDIPWRVAFGDGTSDAGRSGLIELMERCLDNDPFRRPSLNDVQTALRAIPQ